MQAPPVAVHNRSVLSFLLCTFAVADGYRGRILYSIRYLRYPILMSSDFYAILFLAIKWLYSPMVKGRQTMSGVAPRLSAWLNLTSTVFFSPGMSAK